MKYRYIVKDTNENAIYQNNFELEPILHQSPSYNYLQYYIKIVFFSLLYQQGCQPWLVQPCNASTTSADPSSVLGPHGVCGGDPVATPKCDLSCYNAQHKGKYLDEIIKGTTNSDLQWWFYTVIYYKYFVVSDSQENFYVRRVCSEEKSEETRTIRSHDASLRRFPRLQVWYKL